VTDEIITWLFWSGAAVVACGTVSATVRYFHFWRLGHKVMAAQAVLQTVLCTAGLVALYLIHELYLPG
jgi:hypothetical protein